jgi:hypothetical protein
MTGQLADVASCRPEVTKDARSGTSKFGFEMIRRDGPDVSFHVERTLMAGRSLPVFASARIGRIAYSIRYGCLKWRKSI